MIRILDDLTINKIAAGEVIERPVNVVKELVENSIDAKAKHISIEIKGGGIDSIRVTDDGGGIPYDEVPTAFLRHATSKIVTGEDLFFLNSLGFRGEALASIASVSHTEMITKVEGDLMGTRIALDCGSVIEITKTGAPEGTTIIVKDLFFNVPARKKFLNTPQAEGTKIIELIENLALCNPDIAFQLIVNGSVKIQTNGSGNLKDVIFRLFGKEVHDALLPIEYEDDFIKIKGFIAKPEVCRPSRSGENYFINKRFAKNDFITRGIEEGYRNFLMQHKYPFVVLLIGLDSFGLDVNVHPAKSEVRITNGEFLVDILNKTIRSTLTGNELIPNAIKPEEEKQDIKRAPEPFEKSLINKNEHIIQKGYDKETVESKDNKESEDEAPNDKSKEFTVDFSEALKEESHLRSNITTISYKSKSDRLEERMKSEENEEGGSTGNVIAKLKEDKAKLENSLNETSAAKETASYENSADNSKEEKIPGSEFKKADRFIDYDPSEEPVFEKPENSVVKSSTFEEFLNSKKTDNSDESNAKSEIGQSILRAKKKSDDALVSESQIDKDSQNEDKAVHETLNVADKSEIADDNSNIAQETVSDKASENDFVDAEEENKEEAKPLSKEEEYKAKSLELEQWLNSIKDKDNEELLKENKGSMVVRIKQSNDDEEDSPNDAFNDLEDNAGEVAESPLNDSADDEEDRLKDAGRKFSVLNDDIKPINKLGDDKENSNKVLFRVKDFDKDDDDEISEAKEKIDFKKVDRFKDTTKPQKKVKEEQSVLFTADKLLSPDKVKQYKIIDQIFDTYWLIAVDNELLIMDQHAAHEKVLYERFMEKFRESKIETQTLAISQVVNLSKAEMDVYLRYKKEFEKFGFMINDFGDRDLFIRGVPTDLFGSEAKDLFIEILSELINVSPSLHIETIETRIATRACKAAVKGNQKITKDDCKKLLDYMLTLENPYQCPHGRPTLIRISKYDLEKMFKRVI